MNCKITMLRQFGYSLLSCLEFTAWIEVNFPIVHSSKIAKLLCVAKGAMFPAMHCILGKWCPPYERSRLAGISYAGM